MCVTFKQEFLNSKHSVGENSISAWGYDIRTIIGWIFTGSISPDLQLRQRKIVVPVWLSSYRVATFRPINYTDIYPLRVHVTLQVMPHSVPDLN